MHLIHFEDNNLVLETHASAEFNSMSSLNRLLIRLDLAAATLFLNLQGKNYETRGSHQP